MNQPSGFSSRNSLILAVFVSVEALPAACSAQQGYGQPSYYGQQGSPDRWNNFYQRGDEISDRVSGFMRRIFNGNQAQRSAYATPAPQAQPQYQAPTYYQQPAPVTAPSSSVYGYNTPPSTSKPVQPATRKSSSSTTPRTSIFSKKPKPKTESAPPPATTKPYEPPQIDNTPPPYKAAEPKVEPKADTKFKPKDVPRIDPGLEPGTTVDTSGKPSANLGSIITDSPKSVSGSSSSTRGDSIPLGKKGSLPTSVYSPYSPYTELDITGMGSGSTVKDPTNGKAFRVP